MVKYLGIGALVVGMAAGASMASDDMIVTVQPQGENNSVLIYTRDHVISPAATVSPELSEQPRPYMIHVQLPGTNTYIDPAANYHHQFNSPGDLDENHWILRAQRLGQALQAQGAMTFYGDHYQNSGPVTIEPHMILLRPPVMQGAPGAKPQPFQMPNAPQTQPSDKEPAKVASSQ